MDSQATLTQRLRAGVAIPACPLALTADGRWDEQAQRTLSHYYDDAGVDGLAVGVHTTQFELHDDQQLLRSVLSVAGSALHQRGALMVAGAVGDTQQALAEARVAADLGYEAVLLCPWGMTDRSPGALLRRARAVGEVLPTIGFYLQESVGGTRLPRAYWEKLFDIESVVAVKTAPFDRYRTNDVVQALLGHDRWDQVALLTGNDDTIVWDLLSPYRRIVAGGEREVRAVGGLLGQWAVGARAATELLRRARAASRAPQVPQRLLADATALVDVNDAVFDAANGFSGCVPGVNETLRQQGLLTSARCWGKDRLSPGQADLIAQARARHPNLLDESFIAENLDRWRDLSR